MPGALIAGLLIGVIEGLSAYLLGAVYQDVVIYALFLRRALGAPARAARHRMKRTPRLLLVGLARDRAAAGADRSVLSAHARARAARRDLRLGVEPDRRLCRPGLGRARDLLRRRRLCRARRPTPQLGWPPIAGAPIGVVVSLALALVIGTPTFRLRGHYFSMATIAAAELIRMLASNWTLRRRRLRADGAGGAAQRARPLLPRIARLLLHLPRRARAAARRSPGGMQRGRMGYYLRAINGSDRAARSLGVAGAALQADRAAASPPASPRSPARSMR